MRLIYLISDDLDPEQFSRILSPSDARYELSRNYLFGGSAGMSICSKRHITRNTQSGIGVTSYQEDTSMKLGVFDDLNRGSLLAIDDRTTTWSPASNMFYIDVEGKLRRYPGSHLPAFYPVKRIIARYEDMVRRYGRRGRPTTLPPRQSTTRQPPLQQTIATAVGTVTATVKAMRPMTKAERWQERKYLIGRGQRSIYPDARIASHRLAQNNVAVEKARLAENVYKTGNPLKDTPGVPEAWRDISNDDAALGKMGLNKKMLFDNDESPNFLARVYQPDRGVFGKDMNPTVAFRGSRAPEFAEGTRETVNKFLWEDVSAIKDIKINNIEDWTNNGAQAFGADSEYYKSAIKIGGKLLKVPNVDISGHSLGGGMASAASIASGKPAWTFNAAGLNAGTVEKYGGSVIGSAKDIQAYRVDGELLTKLQEVNFWQNAKDVYFNPAALAYKELGSSLAPNAAGIPHSLSGGTGSMLDKHGIDQAIKLIEAEKDDDIATIRGRI